MRCGPTRSFKPRSFRGRRAHCSLKHASTGAYSRSLRWWDLTLLSLGSIIGAGVFVLTGQAAADHAGPAIVLSFVIAGTVAAFSALCYAELAGLLPCSGSAYTYSYASLGELVAWCVGWTLLLEYIVASATVAVSFSGYLSAFTYAAFGLTVEGPLTQPPLIYDERAQQFVVTGGYFDLPAVLLLLALTAVLVVGIKESSALNAFSVGVKVVVIVIFIAAGAAFVNPANWQPFVPANEGGDRYGARGVFRAASVVFFAYIGFDSVSTVAQESVDPAVSLPISIILSLTLSTFLYILVALVLTGLVPYTELEGDHPIAVGIRATGIAWLEPLVDFGALCGLASTCLTGIMGIGRVAGTMAADGLLPQVLAGLHPRFRTPWISTIAAGMLAAIMAALLPISVLASLTSAGTLLAFFVVCVAVPVMRKLEPGRERLFKVPLGWTIPILGAGSSLALLVGAGWGTALRLLAWLIVGFVLYFFTGFRRPFPEETKDDVELAPTGAAEPSALPRAGRKKPRRRRTGEGGEPLLHGESGDDSDSSTSSTRPRTPALQTSGNMHRIPEHEHEGNGHV
ncbi:amino acid/polyamine/organocation transporter, apc superfamily [Hyaloraphidium curvatum]|nr:amino acid/polyamine/organocation transporter, apc superfamily [Hyaloraphidium curvatum]